MSALTDLFTTMANSIRGKTGTQTTYTPSEMATDGIDDVYAAGYAAGGGGGGGAVPITPSNSSPASMSANVAYEPTANGYAIESYSSVTPSDSTPAALTNGAIYKAGGAGYAIASNPTSVTPSSSGVYFSSGIKKMASSGYAYSTEQLMKVGTFTNSTSAQTTVNCGFKPKYLAVTFSSPSLSWTYDERQSTTQFFISGSATYLQKVNLSTTNTNRLYSINNDGFTLNKMSTAGTGYYFAIG